MWQLSSLPTLNAFLNATSAILLLAGYRFIRQQNVRVHKICMVAAFAVSVLFLLSYLTYHYYVGTTRFTGQGWVRTAYFTLLISHTILAALVPFLALMTLFRALKGQFPQHRRIARWTLPIWLYVSVTGILVYVMLYQLYPQTTQEQAESTRLGADTSVSEETTASERIFLSHFSLRRTRSSDDK